MQEFVQGSSATVHTNSPVLGKHRVCYGHTRSITHKLQEMYALQIFLTSQADIAYLIKEIKHLQLDKTRKCL